MKLQAYTGFVCVYAHLVSSTLCNPIDHSCPWDSPGKNTGVGCHFLLQGNLSDQGTDPMSLAYPALQVVSLTLSHLGNPMKDLQNL